MKTRYMTSAICLILSRFILLIGIIGLIFINFSIMEKLLGFGGALFSLILFPIALAVGPVIALIEGNFAPLALTFLILAMALMLYWIGTHLLLTK